MVLGMVLTSDRKKEYMKEYNSRPEVKERNREYQKIYRSKPENKERIRENQKIYRSKPENKERIRENKKIYRSKPENKEREREYQKIYNSKPENKEHKREYNKEYYSKPENKEHRRRYNSKPENKERMREKLIEKKLIVYKHYSDNDIMCKQCGMREIDALSLDHIYDNGSHHRKKINENCYNWTIRNNFPPIFQVLCMNCNTIKERRRRRNLNNTQF